MKRKLLFIATLLLSALLQKGSYAQSDNIFENNYPNSRSELGLHSNYFINSSGITNTFIKTYLTNSFIDDALKENVSGKLSSSNLLGHEFNVGIYYLTKRDTLFGIKNAAFFIDLKNRHYADARFSRDLFDVYFFGNKKFAGKTADFNFFNLNYLKYQQARAGIMKYIIKEESVYMMGLGFSLLKGQEHVSVKADRAELYTQEDGGYIDVNLGMTMHQSDTLKKSFWAKNGVGFSSDLFFSFSGSSGNTLRLSISDFGYIRWNYRSVNTHADTSFRFEGEKVDNIFKLEDSVYVQSSDSSYWEKFITGRTTGGYTYVLPALFDLSYEKVIKEYRFTVMPGVRYRLAAGYLPNFYLRSRYFINSETAVSLTLSYGGFGRFTGGIELAKDFGKGFIFILGSNYLSGYMFPSSSSSQGIHVLLKKFF